jgi:6,7-dimethyl-8-ribityllumazine synthase
MRIQGQLNPQDIRVGIVTSRFNIEITEKLEHGAIERLTELGLADNQIIAVRVPGAIEIPLAAEALLELGCDGVIALGAVIRGETSHYDYVCNAVERGCTLLQLESGRPVVFGVLTTENEEQALDRVGGRHGHKGTEAAEVVVEMVDLMKKLKGDAYYDEKAEHVHTENCNHK